MNKLKKLHEVLPREQAGSRTSQQYDYQYCQVATECFGLFETSEKLCVFCEWHDDFVIEHSASKPIDIYAFTQVKTKALSRGPWKLNEVFGAGGKGKTLQQDSPFFRMLQNYLVFKDQCRKFIFVTNSAVDPKLSSFLQDISKSGAPSELTGNSKKEFEKLWKGYEPHFNGASDLDFHSLLMKFEIKSEVGNLGEHINLLRTQIQDRVKEFCEIDLKSSHAERITTNIIDLVRKKSQHQVKSLPIKDEDLRVSKSIKAEDVFEFLPLSKDGLKALQSGKKQIRENVLSLSRLQRLCQDSDIPETLIVQICNFKVAWDLWIQDKKHDFEKADFEAFKLECIKALSDKDTSLNALGIKAQDISKIFNPKLPEHLRVSETLVLGFIFSLASQMKRKTDE